MQILRVTLGLLLLFFSHAQAAPVHSFVVSDFVVNSGQAHQIESFVRYLSEKSGYPMQAVFTSHYTGLSDILRDHPDSIGWTCGAPYVEDHKAYGQQLVAVPLFHGNPLYHSLVLTQKNRPEKQLSDFKGKVLAYSDIRSNSGFISPAYALHEKGIDISKYFRLTIDTGSHENSIEALLGGLADVSAVDEYVWVEYVKTHHDAASKLKEIGRMGPYPFTPVVAGPKVDAATLKKLEDVLTGMKDDAKGRAMLKDFGMDGFVLEPDSFYAPIAKMLAAVRPDGGSAK